MDLNHPDLKAFEPLVRRIVDTAFTGGLHALSQAGHALAEIENGGAAYRRFIRGCHYGFNLAQSHVASAVIDLELHARQLPAAPSSDREARAARLQLLRVIRNRQINHGNLSEQLTGAIRDRALSDATRQIALTIAEQCHAVGVAHAAADIALDSTESLDLRVDAGYAVWRLNVPDASARLKPLAFSSPTEDPSGQVPDIRVDVIRPAERGDPTTLTVIVEVKGCWHTDVETAMADQLTARYLQDNDCQTGLYLVGWYLCDGWDASDTRKRQVPWTTMGQAENVLQRQAAGLTTPEKRPEIRAYVLDCALR